MASRFPLPAILLVLAGALDALRALDVPSGVVALPAGDKEQVPCGGAAAVISADGLAITLDEALPSHGVAGPGQRITVVLPGGRRREAEIVRRGSTTGAVLLRIANLPDGIRPLTLADSARLRAGDTVWTAGNAFGALELDGAAALSQGIISGSEEIAADAPPVRGRGGRVLSSYRGPVLEIDAAVNDGNQGGPLLDDAGRLIGLVSLGSARGRRLGTAVPIHLVARDLGLDPPGESPASGEGVGRALLRAAESAARGIALIYFERPTGLGNPDAVPRPTRPAAEAPAFERERLQRWWDTYYHQQQMFYTDQPVPALVVDAGAGLLLTARSNLHGDAERGAVLLADGTSVPCTVIASHLPLDLALLRADKPLAMPALALASSPQLANGQPIAVVGRHLREGGFTLTTGVVSATARRRAQNEFAFAQTDALANYGSLGGAVVDAAGAVVGMVVMLGPDGRSLPWAINSGVALFVDSATLLRVLPGLTAGDSVKRAPIIGMGVGLAHRPGIKPLVISVAPGTGAEAAGIQRGDVLLEVDGFDAVNQQAISRALLKHRQGDMVTVKIQRGMEILDLQIEIRSFADEEK